MPCLPASAISCLQRCSYDVPLSSGMVLTLANLSALLHAYGGAFSCKTGL